MALKGLGAHGPGAGESGDEGDAPIVAEINITPLTDVFLVLLIIFMVTSSVMSQMGVSVNLPQASSATSEAQPEGVIVTLLAGGALQVNGDPVAAGEFTRFEKLLKSSFVKTASRLVILEGDRQAFLGSAIEVMDHARRAGAEKFAIATAPESSK
ncbi:MAG: biopolymer transporter ExbD [Oligoflexia bacterium]|nr:biopolymer transporter ExbD [Oligoflexia bacterium]